MRFIDVFNGDADGLCALHQLRLADPVESELVTGLKREIDLLARVQADSQSIVTVLDVSLDRNRDALLRLLSQGAEVHYFDHHIAHFIPRHPRLQTWIDPSAQVCTSTLVDQYLGGRFRSWAIVAAFGDGLPGTAAKLADAAGFDTNQRSKLCALGEALNYNGYGETEADVMIHPRELFGVVHRYADPLALFASEPVIGALLDCMAADLDAARQLPPIHQDAYCSVHRLPKAAWSRRVIGTLANRLAQSDERRTCAVVMETDSGGLRVSLRVARAIAPEPGDDADQLCRRFGGAGRAGAAGIHELAADRLEEFVQSLCAAARRWVHGSEANIPPASR
ncbi:MAG TPA: hypothetical protein VED83_05820 [Burkholderiaceae bacterium]|nr:hypothetical protein [Burkholderiaceae bacterium]HYB50074.1 hypothetical protein [Burkholderiaceae bacterium]